MKLVEGYNDFETKYPKLAEQWVYDNSEGKTPYQVVPKSAETVEWICGLHATVRARTSKEHRSYRKNENAVCVADQGNHCNEGETIVPGLNDRATLDPHLTEE